MKRVIAQGDTRPMADSKEAMEDLKVILAGRAEKGGQKIHNLLAATAQLSQDVAYLAFADSDARLRRQC